jgi:hypothetical protein
MNSSFEHPNFVIFFLLLPPSSLQIVANGAGSEADGGGGWSVAEASEARGVGGQSEGRTRARAWQPRMAEEAVPLRPWVAAAQRPQVGDGVGTSTGPWRLREEAAVPGPRQVVAR